MARDYTLITAILGTVIRTLYAYQRRMARRAGHRGAKCASVTFVQRFGGAVNSNVHFHVLAPDAVFVPGETEDDVLRVVPLPVPEDKDILGILDKVVRRVSNLVQKRCGLEDEFGIEPETEVLDGAIDEAMRNVPRVPSSTEDEEPSDEAFASARRPDPTAVRSSHPLPWPPRASRPRSRPAAGRPRDRHPPRGLGPCGPCRTGPGQLDRYGTEPARQPGPYAKRRDERGSGAEVRPPRCRAIASRDAHLTAVHDPAHCRVRGRGKRIIASRGDVRPDRAAQASAMARLVAPGLCRGRSRVPPWTPWCAPGAWGR